MDLPGAVLMLVQTLSLGLNQVLIKMVNAGLHPVFQAGLRSLAAIVPVVIIAWFWKRKLSISDGSFWPGVACGLLFGVEFLLLFTAFDYTTVARVSILFYCMPVWVTLAAHYLIPGETLTTRKVMGLGCAVAGITLAMAGRAGGDTSVYGDALALAASMCWAGIVLLARGSRLKRASPEMQLIYQLVVSALLLLPVALLASWVLSFDLVREMSLNIALIFAFQVIFIVAIGFSIWFRVLATYPASVIASFGFLAPVFGVFFGWWLLDEHVSLYVVFSLVLVCVGIVLINRPRA